MKPKTSANKEKKTEKDYSKETIEQVMAENQVLQALMDLEQDKVFRYRILVLLDRMATANERIAEANERQANALEENPEPLEENPKLLENSEEKADPNKNNEEDNN